MRNAMNSVIQNKMADASGSPMEWKNILVPVGFSASSGRAVGIAVYLAAKCGAKITLLHVVQMADANNFETGAAMCDLVKVSTQALDEVAGEIPAASLGEKLVRVAAQEIAGEIVAAAREIPADLIVIATHPYHPLRQMLHGSRTEELLHHAPCPVLLVRPSHAETAKT